MFLWKFNLDQNYTSTGSYTQKSVRQKILKADTEALYAYVTRIEYHTRFSVMPVHLLK